MGPNTKHSSGGQKQASIRSVNANVAECLLEV